MPHCIIEYSKDLEKTIDPSQLLTAVYLGALSSKLFASDDIKSRTLSFEHFQCGTIKSSFVHVTTKILSGRTLEQRTMLSNSILAELRNLDFSSTSLTVEVVDIEKASYAKIVT